MGPGLRGAGLCALQQEFYLIPAPAPLPPLQKCCVRFMQPPHYGQRPRLHRMLQIVRLDTKRQE